MTILWVIISIIAVIEIAVFSILTLSLYTNLELIPRKNSHNPNVTVVVPFKDEDQNIYNLLSSISKQNYTGNIEIILVNDSSTDNFEKEIKRAKEDFPSLDINLINSNFDQDINLTGKQQALDCGVKAARYDYIAFTDADVTLKNNWLTSLTIDTKPQKDQLIFGHTSVDYSSKKGILPLFEALQLEFLFVAAYLFSRVKLSGSCMGNNFLLSKRLYNDIGGQRALGYSITEDRELLKMVSKKGAEILPSFPFSPTVISKPSESLIEFIDQSLRWIRGGLKGFSSLFFILLLIATSNILFVFSVLGIVPAPYSYLQITASALMILLAIDTAFKNDSQKIILLFPIYYVMFILETPIMAILLLFRRPKWKGRKI